MNALCEEMKALLTEIAGQENPNRYGYDCASVALNDTWRERVHTLLAKLAKETER